MDNFNPKLDVRGLSGLVNIGNTCYMNSALQCLSASPLFISYLIKKKFVSDLKNNIVENLAEIERKKKNSTDDDDEVSVYLKDVKKKYYNSMTYNTYKLFKTLWKANSKVTPRTFKTKLGENFSNFRGFQQQDSQEFINILLDKIHEENKSEVTLKYKNIPEDIMNYIDIRKKKCESLENEKNPELLELKIKDFEFFTNSFPKEETIFKSLDYWDNYIKKNYSPIIDIFTGLFMGEITCKTCNSKFTNFEPFNILPLPIPDNVQNLNDCLKEFSKCEILEGDNKYNCSCCKQYTNAEKRLYLWDLPELLIVQMKRFTNNGRNTRKNNDIIKFPFENLTFDDNYHEYRKRNYNYDLYGVVYHMGSLHGGHYISFTKNPINNNWYRFNDETVHHIPNDKIEEEILNGGSYILFYKKNYKISKDSSIELDDSNDDDELSSIEDVE